MFSWSRFKFQNNSCSSPSMRLFSDFLNAEQEDEERIIARLRCQERDGNIQLFRRDEIAPINIPVPIYVVRSVAPVAPVRRLGAERLRDHRQVVRTISRPCRFQRENRPKRAAGVTRSGNTVSLPFTDMPRCPDGAVTGGPKRGFF